jgi:hypothetical protein
MLAMARETLRFLACGWPEAHIIKDQVYVCQLADNLPDHDYFLLTKLAGCECWVPVTSSDVMLIHEIEDNDGQNKRSSGA